MNRYPGSLPCGCGLQQGQELIMSFCRKLYNKNHDGLISVIKQSPLVYKFGWFSWWLQENHSAPLYLPLTRADECVNITQALSCQQPVVWAGWTGYLLTGAPSPGSPPAFPQSLCPPCCCYLLPGNTPKPFLPEAPSRLAVVYSCHPIPYIRAGVHLPGFF